MLSASGLTFSKIIVCVGQSDLRRGVDGLAAQIRLMYNLDPMEKDVLFLFCGVKSDRIKGLLWTGDRFVLLYIRLAEGHFRWPRTPAEARQLNSEQFTRLMEGYTIDSAIGKKRTVEKKDPKLQRKR